MAKRPRMATGSGLSPPAIVYHLLLFGIDQTHEATSLVNAISLHQPLATSLAAIRVDLVYIV
jgi:hypothetical protein